MSADEGTICGVDYRRVRPASPVPLETMIEEMGGVHIMRYAGDRGAWTAWIRDSLSPYSGPVADGDTPREAIEKLHAAWRERQDGE